MRDSIIESLRSTGRDTIERLINFIDKTDFFIAPCSTKFHLAQPGGLAQHTWNVMKCADEMNAKYGYPFPTDSVIISAFGHDLCKIGFYKEVHEDPTDPQMRYLTTLLSKKGFKVPMKLNKAYAGALIEFMLNSYREGMSLPSYIHNYVVDDQLPLGHGEKSLYIMQQFIELTTDEALAIRWHMACFDAGIHFSYPSGFAFNEAVKKSKLVTIILLADIEASNLMEA